MALLSTINFLPAVFRSPTNQRFLGATMDQLASDAVNTPLNGFIGRKFAPTYRTGDNYVSEISAQRQNYQLEASVVVTDSKKNVKFNAGYIDLLNSIATNNGLINNQQRLFTSECYTYDGRFDYDKFVNYYNYYWLPNGPAAVDVSAFSTLLNENFVVTRNTAVNGYVFSNHGPQPNLPLTLVRGGTYTFAVNQPGYNFWIQSEPGVSGVDPSLGTVSTRDVFGVTNNGTDNGVITFTVPAATAQDFYATLPTVQSVDIAVDNLKYTDIHGVLLSTFIAANPTGFDGINNQLHGITLIFVNNLTDDAYWTVSGTTVAQSQRTGVWQISLVPSGNDYLMQLVPLSTISSLEKVFIRSGVTYASHQFWLNNSLQYRIVPNNTAILNYLYYQDSSDSNFIGVIKLVDNVASTIDVAADIIGQPGYISPNGVKFTNGLKIKFDNTVTPDTYANNEYYVDGVGTAIKLVPVAQMAVPEPYSYDLGIMPAVTAGSFTVGTSYTILSIGTTDFTAIGASANEVGVNFIATGVGVGTGTATHLLLPSTITPDYITINRSSQDLNSWSRSNRWFHVDVINAVATYNGTTANYGPNIAARRPIIEFDPNLQLFNHGQQAGNNITYIVFAATDAFAEIEGQISYTLDGSLLKTGDRIVFANDHDVAIINQIWQVEIQRINNTDYITLVPTVDDPVLTGQNFLVTSGVYAGRTFYFTGTAWLECQVKHTANQPPLFDLVDRNGYSFSNQTIYPSTTFVGSRLFGYNLNYLTASSLVAGSTYKITSTGTTDFTAISAANNNYGTIFTATGAGTGTGTCVSTTGADAVLGFPLTYETFNNIGDILFDNFYDTDTFTYVANQITTSIECNSGYMVINNGLGNTTKVTNWITNLENSDQDQIFTTFFEGRVVTIDGVEKAFVQIDILPAQDSTIPYLKVFLNNNLLVPTVDFQVVQYGVYNLVTLTAMPTIGDKIDIEIFSNEQSQIGYYEVPENLDLNALNENFNTITLGQLRTHYNKLIENTTTSVTGNIPTQDRYLKRQGGSLNQQQAPVIYAMTFLNDSTANFVSSLTLARKEYAKFKNKFLSLCSTMPSLDPKNPITGVDAVLQSINSLKNSSFPWYYSDMVPYSGTFATVTYEVINVRQLQYEISSIFDNTTLSSRAVLVYVNGVQQTLGVEYSFSSIAPAIIFNRTFAIGDVITIRDYPSTDGNYIPETPTKLGLYPKSVPEIFVDDTYQTPISVIRGHDGSITPAFGDFRDDYLLELERRIYNNIKTNYDLTRIDLDGVIPGRFRTTDYTLDEYNSVMAQNFLEWAGTYNVNYTENPGYDANNPWTWNYSQFTDTIDGSYLQGYWREIYEYWYDTSTPHLTPWKMVGYSSMPSWWVSRYGPAPYTRGNSLLWEDLQNGIKWNDGNPIVDVAFARPGLTGIIPVDTAGNLLDPTAIPLVKQRNPQTANSPFLVGQGGPAETAWRRSSDYPFAIQLLMALTKPARYFATQLDTSRFYTNPVTGHFTDVNNKKITPSALTVNGATVNGVTQRTSGYINWIGDYIKNLGINPVSVLTEYFNNFSVQLNYKVAGFTDYRILTVSAEQTTPSSTGSSVIIPNDNFKIYLNKSVPVATAIYSAVIVEKTLNGYAVSGYGLTNPSFTIVPSVANKNATSLTLNEVTVQLYNDSTNNVQVVPYGTEFTTVSQVTDFLISYQRYLELQGFTFKQFNSDLNVQQDWTLSVKEFMYWSQQGWAPGTTIILNPIGTELRLTSVGSVVDQITNTSNGNRLLDENFNPIKANDSTIVRIDNPLSKNTFAVTSINGSTIAYAKLNLIQYEHVLIFDNVDDFGDIIFIPSQGTRQYRLKVTGAKTGLWDGSLSATGYIYNNPNIQEWLPGVDYKLGDLVTYNNFYYTATQKIPASTTFDSLRWTPVPATEIQTGLLPSFGLNAQEFTNFYDVDNPPQDSTFLEYSSGLIGFRQRPYLTDLGISVPTQTKFYQGFIKEKGSMNAITALTRANFNNIGGNVNVYEEWAFQVGTYGGINSTQFREFILDESKFDASPITITLGNTYSKSNAIVTFTTGNIYRTSNLTSNTTAIYSNRVSTDHITDLPTVGYVNINDVDITEFNIATPTANVANISVGSKVWTAKNGVGAWGVYRVSETNITAISLTSLFGTSAKLIFSGVHSFQANDTLILQNFNDLYNGIYTVVSVIDTTSVEITISASASAAFQQLFKSVNVTGSGSVYRLATARFDTFATAANSAPLNGWIDNDRVWVDNIGAGWGVYTYSNVGPTWTLTRSEEPRVDLDSISRTLMYNKKENSVLAALDYIDPAKGKVLTIVDKDIDFKRETDPALYNAGTGRLSADLYWGAEEVGKIWWNLDTIRYINYEQDSLVYRLTQWGTQFPGSSVDVYQWIESTVLPSQYVANGGQGTPLHPDDSAYCTYGYVNPSTGVLNVRYYYWVKDLISIAGGKSNSTLNIASVIADPHATNVPYAAILRDDTVALYNVNDLLVGQNTVVQLGSRTITQNRTSEIIHSEYTLVQEGNSNSVIPDSILTKLADSLSGIDQFGSTVPDVTLPQSEAYGIGNRPLQSMVMNRALALQNAIAVLNPMLLAYPVVENKVLTTLNSGEPVPAESLGLYSLIVDTVDQLNYIDTTSLSAGYAVLVTSDSTNSGKWAIYELNVSKQFIQTRVQSYLTPLYWTYADWYDSSFDPTTVPTVTVANRLEYGKLTLQPDTYVKIIENGNGQFVIYYIDSNLNQKLVGIQGGTIQISTGTIPSIEMRQILIAMQSNILIDDLASDFNRFFFSMIKYILTEQKNLDWVFKTSFINATQSIRKLQEYPAYVPDNQSFYLDYINEVKPYRTKIREFVVDYIGNDQFAGDITDFDLPPYWDANLQVYRSPNGDQPYDITMWSNPNSVYNQWYNWHTYDIVGVIMERGGTGYVLPPTVTFIGDGTGAEGYATINSNGEVTGVVITKSGEGYSTQPTVQFNGTGTGAKGYVVIREHYVKGNISDSYNLVRSISTTMKFDRTTYTNPNTFVQWTNVTTANIGEVISANVILVLDSKLYQLANAYTIEGNITTDVVSFPFANTTEISANTLTTATDRVVAFNGNVNLEVIDGVGYPGVIVTGNTFTSTDIDSVIFSRYTDPLGINPGDINIDGGAYYDTYNSHAPQELIPGRTYDSVSIRVRDTQNLSFRNFLTSDGTAHYSRIANANVTTLTTNFSLFDTVIHVADGLKLPPASPTSGIPGTLFINGEKVTYYRNYAWETVTPWIANTSFALDTIVSYLGNTYLTTGNTFGNAFTDVASNVTQIDINSVTQIRRGVDRTTPNRVNWTGNTSISYFEANNYSITASSSGYVINNGNNVPVSNFQSIASVYKTDWQGTQLMYPTPRTNMFTYSEQLDHSDWFKYFGASVVADVGVAPDGTTTADQIVFAGAANEQVGQTISGLTIGQSYTFSAFVKSDGTMQYAQKLYVAGSFTTFTPSASWTRVSLTFTASTTSHALLFLTGTATTASFLVWGADVKEGATLSSYIQTTTASVTVTDYVAVHPNLIEFAVTPVTGSTMTWSGTYIDNVANTSIISTDVIHPIGSTVIDTSITQDIPGITSNVITLTANTTFSTAATSSVSYGLRLFGNITVDAGDELYQYDANLNLAATMKVLETVTNADTVPVILTYGHLLGLPEQYDTSLGYDHLTFSTIASALEISSQGIGNLVVSNSFVLTSYILGMVDAAGQANVAAGTTLKIDNTWYNLGTDTVTDGAGLINSTTIQAEFLKAQRG